ncbi:3-deoxy-manno-octulosonate cytidylyltransferase [Candidatus Pelagibacter sp.]|uniref:3-deoxy-manno-octulosonate cytidylyltransferase n=1 Tax=Candidatus Pelagibacter sp. TaxID=2024849 RepID=UPI003F84F656
MKSLIVIPARFKSSRLPGKPLKKIDGKELILRVLNACEPLSQKGTKTIVATDEKKIFNLVKFSNFRAIMTSKKCLTGTDRVAEAAKKIKADIYINVQGDEPLVNYRDIKKIIEAKKKFPNHIICGYSYLKKDENVNNKNIPKVILNKREELLYISRSPIPGSKKKLSKKHKYLKQVCIYGFNKNDLNLFSSLKKKMYLENLEDIEILRFLEIGKKIKMIKLSSQSYAVDTSDDLKKVEKIFKSLKKR